jgi:hypothetical protein
MFRSLYYTLFEIHWNPVPRILLESSWPNAQVNTESLPGHREYLSLVDFLVLPILKMVRLLLEYHADLNAGYECQSPFSLAISLVNEPAVDLLNCPCTNPSTILGAGNGNAVYLLLPIAYELR